MANAIMIMGGLSKDAGFAAMAVGALLSWGNLIQEVAIMPEGLQLRTLLKLRSLSWQEISGIDMSTIKDERAGGSGRAFRIVKVLLKNGKPIQMPPSVMTTRSATPIQPMRSLRRAAASWGTPLSSPGGTGGARVGQIRAASMQ